LLKVGNLVAQADVGSHFGERVNVVHAVEAIERNGIAEERAA